MGPSPKGGGNKRKHGKIIQCLDKLNFDLRIQQLWIGIFGKGNILNFNYFLLLTLGDWVFFQYSKNVFAVGYSQNKTKDQLWPLSADRDINDK